MCENRRPNRSQYSTPLNSMDLNDECPELVNMIKPSNIRFPGGSVANYFHFNGTGFGFEFDEVIGSVFESQLTFDEYAPVNFIEPFADMALRTGSNVMYVVNFFTHFRNGGAAVYDPNDETFQYLIQENLAAIDYLINRGINVVGVELGNELYAYTEVNLTQGLINKYFNLSKVYSDSIKARYPDMRAGVILAPTSGFTHTIWNNTMRFANHADAYIIHEYERGVKNFCSSIENQEEHFTCAKQKMDNFLDAALGNTLKKYRDLVGHDHEFWLTEWNMLDPFLVSNSLLHGYFIFKYWNKLAEFSKDRPGDITVTNCHNLVSGGYLYPAVGKLQSNESPDLMVTGDFALRSSYYAHRLMSNIYMEDYQFIGKTTLSDCQAWLYKAPDGTFELAMVNDNESAKSISYSQVEAIIGTNQILDSGKAPI